MVCQHIQSEVLIQLVPKVLEPNLPLWQSVTKHITKIKMLKGKQPNYTLLPKLQFKLRLRLDWAETETRVCVSAFFFFFFHVFKAKFCYCSFTVQLLFMNSSHKVWLFPPFQHKFYCSRTHKFHFSATFSLKMGPTILFTYLKIILLQYFSVFSFSFQFSAVSKRTLTTNYQLQE